MHHFLKQWLQGHPACSLQELGWSDNSDSRLREQMKGEKNLPRSLDQCEPWMEGLDTRDRPVCALPSDLTYYVCTIPLQKIDRIFYLYTDLLLI